MGVGSFVCFFLFSCPVMQWVLLSCFNFMRKLKGAFSSVGEGIRSQKPNVLLDFFIWTTNNILISETSTTSWPRSGPRSTPCRDSTSPSTLHFLSSAFLPVSGHSLPWRLYRLRAQRHGGDIMNSRISICSIKLLLRQPFIFTFINCCILFFIKTILNICV